MPSSKTATPLIFAKDLVLIGDDRFVVHTGTAVKNWHKLHLKASIAGRKVKACNNRPVGCGRSHHRSCVPRHHKDDIFSRRLGIAKSVADIEAKGMPI